MKSITAKLGNMRKAADWVVYPTTVGDAGTLMIQSDTRIAQFDPATGAGMLSAAHGNGSYFMHLNAFMGAKPVIVPADVIALALGAQPKSGDQIGPGVFIA
jgi:hypothetical protein